jgi:hypothetical protein
MADRENIGWLRERLQASLAIEPKDPTELLDWLQARRMDVPFSAELMIPSGGRQLASGR